MKELHLSPKDDIQKAVNGLTEPAKVYLAKGVYKQKIEIWVDDVTIIGEDREKTVLTYDDYARKTDENGVEYNTFRSWSLLISGERVRLENLTVENSNPDPRQVGQCVALSVNCRNFSAKNVDLRSTQDTLFGIPFPDEIVVRHWDLLPRRHLYLEGTSLHIYENCRIYGTVDFIFGGAEMIFKNCEIVSVYDARGMGYLAAPCHALSQKHGFYFLDCDIRAENVEPASIFLARPWRDFGKCAFLNCRLGKHIKPELFNKWNDTARDRTARFAYYNLKCDFEPAPVSWSHALTETEANDIIKHCNEMIATHNS